MPGRWPAAPVAWPARASPKPGNAAAMTIGIWVLGDQLNAGQAALASADPATSRVLLVESASVLARRAYHRQKLVLVWSAMRHFEIGRAHV